ncbi:MAG: homoaconitase [Gemmatimonadota bacterium]
MRQTVVEKIAQAHRVEGPARPLRAGDMVSLRPRHVLTHDNTAAVMTKFAALGAVRIHDPRQSVFALDHDIQNTTAPNLARYAAIEAFARAQGVDFHPAGEGIGHQLVLERGYAVPGALVVASDSHANMYGAVGALGTPVVRTDAAVLWATGTFWWQIPPTVQVVLEGALPEGVTGKDVILALCGLYRRDEVLNAAVEFTGPGVASLDMSARMSVANMTTEWGALAGWFPVDGLTLGWLAERQRHLRAMGVERIKDADLVRWRAEPPAPDPDAPYAGRITLDLTGLVPQAAGPDAVQAVRPVGELAADRVPVQRAYLLSCANGRLEDLEAAAAALGGRRVAPTVQFYVAAASREVQAAAQASGAWEALERAGAHTLPPGCGACIGLGQGLLEAGEVGISATNRNFKGRMGHRDAHVYLASPAVVAASAVAGRIVDGAAATPRSRLADGRAADEHAAAAALPYAFERCAPPASESVDEEAELLDGFPGTLTGRLVFLPKDDLNTDGIYGKDHTYRELSAEEMAAVVMENYDPLFVERSHPGDILVAGRNFGSGSSREQAATALQAHGIRLVVAASFSQTYQRNAFNNALICIACPELVARLWEETAAEAAAGAPTIVPGGELEVDFVRGSARWGHEAFRFTPLGAVPQSLVAAGGIEAQVRARLAGHATV